MWHIGQLEWLTYFSKRPSRVCPATLVSLTEVNIRKSRVKAARLRRPGVVPRQSRRAGRLLLGCVGGGRTSLAGVAHSGNTAIAFVSPLSIPGTRPASHNLNQDASRTQSWSDTLTARIAVRSNSEQLPGTWVNGRNRPRTRPVAGRRGLRCRGSGGRRYGRSTRTQFFSESSRSAQRSPWPALSASPATDPRSPPRPRPPPNQQGERSCLEGAIPSHAVITPAERSLRHSLSRLPRTSPS